jgi:uncharacterized protein YqgC (DUF456 family)
MSDTILIILGAVLQLAGLAGCILPVLAGPPLNFVGLILLCLAKGWETFSPAFLIVLGVLTGLSVLLDYYLPLAGTKKYGSSKRGFWGAFVGMILGILFFPPLGMILGAFVGAVVGEMTAGKQSAEALRAGWGAFVGVLLAMIFRLILSGIMTFSYIIKTL